MRTPRIRWKKTFKNEEKFDCKKRKKELNKKIRKCDKVADNSDFKKILKTRFNTVS